MQRFSNLVMRLTYELEISRVLAVLLNKPSKPLVRFDDYDIRRKLDPSASSAEW